jgi:hypothetical protein
MKKPVRKPSTTVRKSRTLPKALGNPYRVLISRARNGYAIEDSEGTSLVVQSEHRTSDLSENAEEACRFQALVWQLAELFGIYGSKHDEARFYACLFPGSNHPAFETAECPVCGREPEKASDGC